MLYPLIGLIADLKDSVESRKSRLETIEYSVGLGERYLGKMI